MRISSLCVDQPEYTKLTNQIHFSYLKLIAQDGPMAALLIYFLKYYKMGQENQNYLLKIGCLLAFVSTGAMILWTIKFC